MFSFVTFSYRTVWFLWLFDQIFGFSAHKVIDSCREPIIKSPRLRLYVYELTDRIQVDVHHCFYREESICDQAECVNCRDTTLERPVYKSRIDQYDDITQQCANATNITTFTDRYGRNHNINKSVTSKSICDKNAVLTSTVQVTIKTTAAMADTEADRIVLNSGTICRYSAGFCYDRKEDVEVVWQVTKGGITCSDVTRIEVVDPSYFVLDNVTYAIFQSQDRHHALELISEEYFCKMKVRGTHGRFIVTEGPLLEANNDAVDVPEDTGFWFENKQDMYDFLIDKCTAKNTGSSGRMVFENTFFQSSFLEMQTQRSHLREWTEQVQRIKSEAEVFCYVIVSVLLLLMVLIALLAYFTLKRNGANTKQCSNASDSVAIVPNMYDYITSEYDINQFYNSK